MERTAKIELTYPEAFYLFQALVLRMEITADRNLPAVTHNLRNVEKKLVEASKEISKESDCWQYFQEGKLDRMRYPIKRVTVSYYEENPKPKPASA